LTEGKRLINIDESVLNQTDKRRRGWFKKGQKNFVSHLERLAKTNLIAAVTSDGDFYFTINCGKNNSRTVLLFLIKLVRHLTTQDPGWR
jgi:transposase